MVGAPRNCACRSLSSCCLWYNFRKMSYFIYTHIQATECDQHCTVCVYTSTEELWVSIMQEPFLEGVPQDILRLANKVHPWAIIVKSTWLKKVQLNHATAKVLLETKNILRCQGFEIRVVQTEKVQVYQSKDDHWVWDGRKFEITKFEIVTFYCGLVVYFPEN